MGKKNDGGPAYPQLSVASCERDGHGDLIDPFTSASGGMSQRDWFAGMALIGLLSDSEHHPASDDALTYEQRVAKSAYDYADAMLSARQNKEGGE